MTCMSIPLTNAVPLTNVVIAVVQPVQALPGGLAEGLTGAVGVAILAAGAAVDVLALKGKGGGGDKDGKSGGGGTGRANRVRMAVAVLVYFSGWLTVLEACHAREWWTGMVTDPGIMFLVRLVALGLLVFLTAGVVGLVVVKVPVQVADQATKKLEHADANKARITPTAVTWAAVTALASLAIPAGTMASSYAINVLNAPGTLVSATLIRGAAHLVGSDGQAPVPAQAGLPGGIPGGGGAR